MILRTTSTPTLRSAAPSSSSFSSSDPTFWAALSRSMLSLTSAPVTTSQTRIRRTSSEWLILMKQPKMKLAFEDDYTFPSLLEETVGAGEETTSFMFSTSSLVAEGGRVSVSVGGGDGDGRDGGGRGGGGGGGGEGHGSESMDAYYQKMIESYPGDALLLGNYAKFLKVVKGDAEKAEEYCERAILAKRQSDGEDGGLLSMYGDIIWKTRKDGVRAQTYFDQALQASPNDCFVLASYAQFLWDSGEDGEEEETLLYSKSLASAAANATQNLTAAS